MYIKKILLYIVLFQSVFFITCCKGSDKVNNNFKEYLEIVNNETNSEELITTIYEINDYYEDVYMSGYSIDEVNKKYKIECLRQVNNVYYAIIKSLTGGKLFVFFDKRRDNEYRVYTSWYTEKKITLEDFNSLELGVSSLDDVRRIDKFGEEIAFSSLVGYPPADLLISASFHYTRDEYYVYITYETKGDSKRVKEIKASKKVDNIFSSDYKENNIFNYILNIDKD